MTSTALNSEVTPLAQVQRLSAGFEGQVVFRRVSFDIPRTGAVGILGPSGGGKSTLLRTLGRWNDLRPSFWAHGKIIWRGRDLISDVSRPEVNRRFALLQQKARLYTSTVLANAIADLEKPVLSTEEKRVLAREVLEPWGLWRELEGRLGEPVISLELALQRRITLARLVSAGAEAVLADEPFRDLEPRGTAQLFEMVSALAQSCALVMITHDQSKARRLLDEVLLLTGGSVVEASPALRFFEEPKTDLGRRFLRSGSCWPLEEEMDPEWLAHRRAEQEGRTDDMVEPSDRVKPSWVPTPQERAKRPGGFHWVEPKLLGGMQWPGLLQDESADLDGAVALGVRHLVNLTENEFPQEKLRIRGIFGHHFPVVDMKVPQLEECWRLCNDVDGWLSQGEPTVFHCRAGLGRTGTLLACMAVLHGRDAVSAIDQVRRVNSMYIQSQEQLAFVESFADFVRARRELAQSAT